MNDWNVIIVCDSMLGHLMKALCSAEMCPRGPKGTIALS